MTRGKDQEKKKTEIDSWQTQILQSLVVEH